ncbi:MAG: hypothetical protein E7321_03475 [Clostridiales bacterium]|nr:hypothetical protein [Clostridiales bacterium]
MLSMSGPYTRPGAVLSALIVVLGVIGLTMHRDFYAGRRRRDFFCFYTNISNLAVLIYFALAGPRLYAVPSLRPLIPHAEFAVTMCITLTFCVFHLVLYPAVRLAADRMPKGRQYWIVYIDNLIIHYLVPISVIIYWLLCSPGKLALRAADALFWTLLPLSYIGWVFFRARRKKIIEETGSPYPYPFLDIQALGKARVYGMCAILYGACVLGSLASIFLIHVLLR